MGLTGAIALLRALNAARAFAAPAGFPDYMGLPLAAPQDAGFVMVYGLRAAFIALAVAALMATRNVAALAVIAAAGLVMPIGDAVLTARAGLDDHPRPTCRDRPSSSRRRRSWRPSPPAGRGRLESSFGPRDALRLDAPAKNGF